MLHKLAIAAAAGAILVLSPTAAAAPPPNDNRANATPIRFGALQDVFSDGLPGLGVHVYIAAPPAP